MYSIIGCVHKGKTVISQAIVEPQQVSYVSRPLWHAKRASRYTKSHRGNFFTGAVAEAYAPDGRRRRFAGAAYKPFPGHLPASSKSRHIPHCPRCCSEDEIITKVCKPFNTARRITAFYLAGDHQPDDASGLDLGVLVPCKHCRRKFRWHIARNTGVITPETMIYSWNIHTGLLLAFSVGWLLERCPDIGVTYERYSQ